MKLFRLTSLQVLLTILAIPALAQTTIQPGVVMEYREDKPQRPLKGVEIEVKYAPSTTSNQKGAFSLQFNRLKPGSKVEVRKISKPGYVIYNDNAVKQWNISNNGTAFTILMADATWFNTVKNSLTSRSIANREKKHKQEIKRLEDQVKAGTLTIQEKEKRILELEDEMEQLKDCVPAYADFVTRINVNECSTQQADIIRALKRGEIELDEAVRRFRGLNLIEALETAYDAKKELESQFHIIDNNIESLYSGIDNEVAILKLAGGRDSFEEIGILLKRAALVDTTNLDRVLDYAQFASQQNELVEAAQFFKIYCNQTKDKEMLVMGVLGIARGEMQAQHWKSSSFFFNQATELATGLLTDSTKNALMLFNLVQFEKSSMLSAIKKYDEADSILHGIYPFFVDFSNKSVNGKYYLTCIQNNWAKICRKKGRFSEAEDLLLQCINLTRELYDLDSIKYGGDLGITMNELGMLLMKQEKYEAAEDYYRNALMEVNKVFIKNPNKYRELYFRVLMNCADCYTKQHKLNEADQLYTVAIEQSIILKDNNPEAWSMFYVQALYQRGTNNLEMNDLNNAELCFNNCLLIINELLDNHPDNVESYDEYAINCIKALYKLSPNNYEDLYVSVKYTVAKCYSNKNKQKEAQMHFNDILDLIKGKEVRYQYYLDKIKATISSWQGFDKKTDIIGE